MYETSHSLYIFKWYLSTASVISTLSGVPLSEAPGDWCKLYVTGDAYFLTHEFLLYVNWSCVRVGEAFAFQISLTKAACTQWQF